MALYDDMDDIKDFLKEHDKTNSTDYSCMYARVEASHADLERETERLRKLARPIMEIINLIRDAE